MLCAQPGADIVYKLTFEHHATTATAVFKCAKQEGHPFSKLHFEQQPAEPSGQTEQGHPESLEQPGLSERRPQKLTGGLRENFENLPKPTPRRTEGKNMHKGRAGREGGVCQCDGPHVCETCTFHTLIHDVCATWGFTNIGGLPI